MARRVTLADVSAAAGVGIATVSRALAPDEHPDVSAATRERIRAVADRLGYRPSITARNLRSGSYRTLSIVLPDNVWGWWEPVVVSAFHTAVERGYHVLVHPIAGQEGGAASAIAALANVPTDGILIFGSTTDPGVKTAADALRLPIVAIDDASTTTILPTISVDNLTGGRMATEHLIAQGHRRIAYVGSVGGFAFADEREQGYRDALAAAGLEVDESLIIRCADAEDESLLTFPEVDDFLAASPGVSAIFCEFDLLAAPVFRSLRRAGITVPDDVAVIGYDDERAAQLLDPPLTTIRQPYEEMGSLAVTRLIEQNETVERVLVRPALRVRQSA